MQLNSMKVPGAVVTTIISVMLYAAMKQMEIEFAGADWLPLALALLGYAVKYLQVWGEVYGTPPPGAAAAPGDTTERSKPMRFLLG